VWATPAILSTTLSSSDTCTMVDSASVFRYLFLAKKKPLGLCNNSPTMQRTQIRWRKQRGRTATMQKICCWAGWERAEGATECADRSGFSLLKWDIKLSLSAHAFLTLSRPLKKANAAKPRRNGVSVLHLILHTYCNAGMVWRPDCLPTWAPPALPDLGTTAPMCQRGQQNSPSLPIKETLSPSRGWKAETGSRHRVH